MTIKLLMLIIFFSIMIGMGFYSRRHTTNISDFVLDGRGVSPWFTAFAYGTSYFSVVVFVGYAGQFGRKYGLASTRIGIGNALIGSLLAWVILGRRIRVMSKHLSSATIPEFFGSRFDNKGFKIVALVIIFAFPIPYTASVCNELSRLFGTAFDIPCGTCVLGMALLTAVYIILGGYMATAIDDFIQGIIMLAGIITTILSVLSGQGGPTAVVDKLAQIPSEVPLIMGRPDAYASFFGSDPINLLGVVILTPLGTWGLPQMIHKFYTIRSEKVIATGIVISTILVIVISGGSYFLGGFERPSDGLVIYNGNGTVAFDTTIPAMFSGLPDVLIRIVVMLVLSASMSTLSSLVLTSSSILTLDSTKGGLVKNMKDKTQLFLMQSLIVVFILISVVLAPDPPDFIAQFMGISWSVLVGAFLAPLLYGLYWKGVTTVAVWASFITEVGIIVSNMLLHYIVSPINAGAATMVAGLVAVPVVSIFSPKLPADHLEHAFSCYNDLVESTSKKILSDDQPFDLPTFKKRKKGH